MCTGSKGAIVIFLYGLLWLCDDWHGWCIHTHTHTVESLVKIIITNKQATQATISSNFKTKRKCHLFFFLYLATFKHIMESREVIHPWDFITGIINIKMASPPNNHTKMLSKSSSITRGLTIHLSDAWNCTNTKLVLFLSVSRTNGTKTLTHHSVMWLIVSWMQWLLWSVFWSLEDEKFVIFMFLGQKLRHFNILIKYYGFTKLVNRFMTLRKILKKSSSRADLIQSGGQHQLCKDLCIPSLRSAWFAVHILHGPTICLRRTSEDN